MEKKDNLFEVNEVGTYGNIATIDVTFPEHLSTLYLKLLF